MLHLREDLVLGPRSTRIAVLPALSGENVRRVSVMHPRTQREWRAFQTVQVQIKICVQQLAEIIFVCSRDEGLEIRQLWCSKCRSRDYVILESDSDDGCWSDGDEVYQKDFEKRQIARERQVKDEMDEYCL